VQPREEISNGSLQGASGVASISERWIQDTGAAARHCREEGVYTLPRRSSLELTDHPSLRAVG
jgi:hypothetical protein